MHWNKDTYGNKRLVFAMQYEISEGPSRCSIADISFITILCVTR